MTAGIDLVNRAAIFIGQIYSTAPGRDDPNSDHKDCSGLIAATYLAETGKPLGANVSVTIFDLAVQNGLEISFSEARNIAGACLLMPENPYLGWGPAGHIGFSDGKGGTIEATPPRVQRLSIYYQNWGSRACLLPGIDYTNAGYGVAPIAEELHKEDEMLLVRNTSKPEDDPDNWFLFTGFGQVSPISHDRVWNMAAYQGFKTAAMTAGEIWALAVDLAKIRDDFINRMKELGAGNTTVIEKSVLVPADPTSLSNQEFISELQRRLS